MKVTDSIMEIASDAWDDAGSNDVETCLKAALEAVFDQFPDATKMVESKVIKDFVDKMEKEIAISQKYSNYYNVNWHDAFRFIQANSEYQALKASISPVSEDKKGKWKMPIPEADEYDWSKLDHGFYKIYWKDGGCSMASVGSLHSGKRWFAPTNWTSKDHNVASSCWNKVKDVKCIMSDAEFNREEEPEQPTDTQDNDGWIEFDGKKQPISNLVSVEVEFMDGEKTSDLAGNFDACWIWDGRFPSEDNIIAYRIIEEPKEQKKEVCGCKIPARCWGGLEGLCGVCRKPLEKKDSKEENKEPKKQTLLEYVTKKYKFDHEVDAPFHRLLVVISDYLEEQNKCK